jgi:catechol 2,3-dioxygenase-like lactoylglutathione lyase family enzyme
MNLIIQHVEVHVTSIEQAREFYVNKLGLEILDDLPEINLLAVKAGQVRISIFGGFNPKDENDWKKCGAHLIFRTENLEQVIEELKGRGVVFTGEIAEAGGFIRDISTSDPDGNLVEFAEYLRDPLKAI